VRVLQTALPGVLLIDPIVHRDGRGYFVETYHADRYRRAGIEVPFVQDNQSSSGQGTVRGLHLQVTRPQGKLVRVIRGEIYDVAVDVRRGSPTFAQWVGMVLSAESFRQCYIPPGFAHGFSVLSGVAEVEYKCTDVYDPASEIGIAWNDPALAIPWQVEAPVLSDRDRRNPMLADVVQALPGYGAPDL
jgi:dTDP-4-dehydrorhamnose 3,5-epimerase